MIPGIALLPFSLNFFVISLTKCVPTDSMDAIYVSVIYIFEIPFLHFEAYGAVW